MDASLYSLGGNSRKGNGNIKREIIPKTNHTVPILATKLNISSTWTTGGNLSKKNHEIINIPKSNPVKLNRKRFLGILLNKSRMDIRIGMSVVFPLLIFDFFDNVKYEINPAINKQAIFCPHMVSCTLFEYIAIAPMRTDGRAIIKGR